MCNIDLKINTNSLKNFKEKFIFYLVQIAQFRGELGKVPQGEAEIVWGRDEDGVVATEREMRNDALKINESLNVA